MAHYYVEGIGYVCWNWSYTSFKGFLKGKQAHLSTPFYCYFENTVLPFSGQRDLQLDL
jgi:hypothetical protein